MGSLVKAITIPVICASTSEQMDADINYLANALERQLNLPDTIQSQPDERWSLASHSTDSLIAGQKPNLILILVEASLDALKLAYARLKPLQHLRDTRFSVIVHGAKDNESGRRYYRRLAMGTLRFLDLPLIYCGVAPQRGADFGQGIATLAQKVKDSQSPQELVGTEELS